MVPVSFPFLDIFSFQKVSWSWYFSTLLFIILNWITSISISRLLHILFSASCPCILKTSITSPSNNSLAHYLSWKWCLFSCHSNSFLFLISNIFSLSNIAISLSNCTNSWCLNNLFILGCLNNFFINLISGARKCRNAAFSGPRNCGYAREILYRPFWHQ